MGKTERNKFTGCLQKKASGDKYNPFTAKWHKPDKGDEQEAAITKNDNDNSLSSLSTLIGDIVDDLETVLNPDLETRHRDIAEGILDWFHKKGVKKQAQRWPSITGDLAQSDNKERFEKKVPIFAIEKESDEHIVCGIVYEPNTLDSEGDKATAEEIKKAAYEFMESGQVFKINHTGNPAKIKILESYLAPVDLTIENKSVKKGSWVLTVRIGDDEIWRQVKVGELSGFSMAGWANTKAA
ncbi:MAG: XkdF-like putative serine protease domain-containing protein [Phycisphaerae bacterium]